MVANMTASRRADRAAGMAIAIAAINAEHAADLKDGLNGQPDPGSLADLVHRVSSGQTPPLDPDHPAAHGYTRRASGTGWQLAATADANYGGDPAADAAALVYPNGDDSGWPTAPTLLPFYASYWPAPPFAAPLPGDNGITVGNVHALPHHTSDAAVSLCRVGRNDVQDLPHRRVWLIDTANPADNPTLEATIADTIDCIAHHRTAGRTVFLHCVAGESRTPTIAAAYLHAHHGIPTATTLDAYRAIKPTARPNRRFHAYLQSLR